MEKHRCKLCSKSFINGRALGGHMKSHIVASLPTRKRLGESPASSSTSSFSDPDGKSQSYQLRENPRKSFRIADRGVSFANLDSRSSSVVDVEESETESEPVKPVRKRDRKSVGETRSRRPKKTTTKAGRNGEEPKRKKKKKEEEEGRNSNDLTTESPEPASSVSDATPEEDLAMCLIKLSRDGRNLTNPAFEKPDETGEGMEPAKRQSSELRRCPIDLNFPPPAEDDEACSVVSGHVVGRTVALSGPMLIR